MNDEEVQVKCCSGLMQSLKEHWCFSMFVTTELQLLKSTLKHTLKTIMMMTFVFIDF